MMRSISRSRLSLSATLRHAGVAVLLLTASTAATGCDDSSTDEIAPVAGGVLWDHTWSYQSTSVELKDDSSIPFPTDRQLLEKIRYGEGGAPPVGDVLEGAEVVFEVDGELLVKPAGYDEPMYFGTNYRVLDEVTLRASIRKSIWFKYSYSYDQAQDTLLVSPEEDSAAALMGFVMDVISATLYSGALDSAAARVSALLFEDARVEAAIDQFLFDFINGKVSAIPIQAPEDVTAWLIQLLKSTGIVDIDTPDRALEAIISPIVEELLPLDREALSNTLVDLILSSELVAKITPDRVEAVLRFALYRHALEKGQFLNSIQRVDMLLKAQD